MCGIWTYIQLQQQYEYQKLFDNFMKLRPRGPDMSSFNVYKNVYACVRRPRGPHNQVQWPGVPNKILQS